MTHKYCVFWYPTILHTELECVDDATKSIEISDEVGTKHQITLDIEGKNLRLKSESSKRNPIEITFRHLDSRKNGLILYSYAINLKEEEAKFIDNCIENVVYHLAKKFYHIHELNHDSDSILTAYISDEKPNLKNNDNPPLIYYLKIFEEKFVAYAKDIFYKNQYLSECKQNDNYTYLILKDKINLLNDSCENALTEYVYCKSLFNSRYNNSVHESKKLRSEKDILIDEKNESLNPLSKVAFNINNSIRYVKYIKVKNWYYLTRSQLALSVDSHSRTHELLEKSDKIGKLSRNLGFLSIGLALISLFIALMPCFGLNCRTELSEDKKSVLQDSAHVSSEGNKNTIPVAISQDTNIVNQDKIKRNLQ